MDTLPSPSASLLSAAFSRVSSRATGLECPLAQRRELSRSQPLSRRNDQSRTVAGVQAATLDTATMSAAAPAHLPVERAIPTHARHGVLGLTLALTAVAYLDRVCIAT